jgi:hypothetical protein
MRLTLVVEIGGRECAKSGRLIIEYDPRPSFVQRHMSKARAEIAAKAREEIVLRARHPRHAISVPIV